MPAEEAAGLGSAPVPELQPDDHVRGEGPVVIEYSDLECPWCAHTHELLAPLPVTRVFRHFPVTSKHPRAQALAQAVEAAALQDAFWPMHDAVVGDLGHVEDPHLWTKAEEIGLDVARFDFDRRSDAVAERVRRDFRAAIRAGVTTTPTLFIDGEAHAGVPGADLLRRLSRC